MGTGQKKKDHGGGFLAQGAILAAAGIVVKLISLFYRIPVNNILGDQGQGYYGTAYEIYALALLLTSYSMPLAVSKLVSARLAKGERKNAWKLFKTALILAMAVGVVVGFVFFFGADLIATHLLSSPYSAYPLRFLAPGLFVVSTIAVLRGYFQGLGNMVPTAVSQVIEQIVNATAAILGASIFIRMGLAIAKEQKKPLLSAAYGAAGATLGPVLGATAALVFLGILIYGYRKKMLARRLARDFTTYEEKRGELIKIILLTCAPVLLSTTLYNISQSFDVVIFNNVMSAQGMAEKEYVALWGIFSGKYNTWINVPLAMANALGVSMMPSLTAAVTTGDKDMILKKVHLVIRFAMLIAIPSFVGLAIMSKPILSLLYHQGDIDTPAMMHHIGAVSIVFFCLSTVTNAVLQGINRMMTPVKNAAISLGIHLVGLFIMLAVLHWNVYALVGANIIFSLSMCVLNQIAIRKAIGYKQEVKKTFLIPLGASLVMGIATFGVYVLLCAATGQTIATILALIVAVAVYGAALLIFGGLTEAELKSMPKGDVIARIGRKLHLLRTKQDQER